MLVTLFASFVLVITASISGLSSVVSADCSYPGSPFNLYKEKNSIQSRGFPTRYNGNEECDWYLYPPKQSVPELLVMDLVLETNVDGIPEAANLCHRASNYLNIAHARACGKEGPICVVFMLRTSGDFSCHRTILDYFSHCTNILTSSWPAKVTFKTNEPDTKMGFQMNYTFVECGANLDKKEETTVSVSTTTLPVERENGTGSITNETESRTREAVPSKPGRATQVPDKASSTPETVAPQPETPPPPPIVESEKTTVMSIKETEEPDFHNTNLVLIIVLVLVCILFCIIVVAVIFRKRLRAWVTEKPRPSSTSQNGSNASYVDAYVIPMEKSRKLEEPIQTSKVQFPSRYRPPSTSSESSDTVAYHKMVNYQKGKENENNNCAGTIENCVCDATQT